MLYTLEEVRKNIEANVIGKVTAVHTVDKHRYRLSDGSIVDSVTQRNILDKPHLIPWAIRLAIEFLEVADQFLQLKDPLLRAPLIKAAQFIHRNSRDDAGTVGGKAHDCLEQWLKDWIATGKNPGDIREYLKAKGHEDSRVWGSARAGAAVFDKYPKVVPVACEILVGWPQHGAGTLDLLVWVPDGIWYGDGIERGHLELWDWKTSNQMDDFYAMQTSAYRYFFQKMTLLKILKVKIFKLDKESDRFHEFNVPFPNRAYAAFRRLSWVYDWRNSEADKLIEQKNRITL